MINAQRANTGCDTRSRPTIIAVAILVAIFLVPQGAHVARADGCGSSETPAPVELCGITTVSGTESASMDVRLPSTVTLDLAHSFWGIYADDPAPKDVTISGGGDFYGFALFEDVPERDGAGLIVGLMHNELASTAFPDNYYTWWDFSAPPGGPTVPRTVTLPAGDYDLYLLAGDTPVTVTLRLDELGGAGELEPTRPVTFDTRLLEARVSVPGTQTMTAGEMGELHSQGVTFLGILDEEVAHVASARGLCRYTGAPEPEETAYAPTCPSTLGNGEERQSIRVGASVDPSGRPTASRRVVDYQVHPAGDYGLGAWFSGAPTAARVAVLAFWLSLDQ